MLHNTNQILHQLNFQYEQTQVGSQITAGLDNNPTTLQTVGVLDIDGIAGPLQLESKVEYDADPGASKILTMYWTFSGQESAAAAGIADIGGSASDGINWHSHEITLTSGASNNDIEYYRTILFSPEAEFLHVAFTVDDLTGTDVALASLDVFLNHH